MNANGDLFLEELKNLCVAYNVLIYAGMRGLMFNFMNEEDKDNERGYYTQNLETKQFITVK